MAAFRLIPKEEKFYADFIALADRIVSGATLLEKMLATDPAGLGDGASRSSRSRRRATPSPTRSSSA